MTKAELLQSIARRIAENDTDYQLTYGRLHIVVADFNIATHYIEWCLDDTQGHDEPLTDLERELGRDFLLMSMEDRNAVLERAEEISTELHREANAHGTA